MTYFLLTHQIFSPFPKSLSDFPSRANFISKKSIIAIWLQDCHKTTYFRQEKQLELGLVQGES